MPIHHSPAPRPRWLRQSIAAITAALLLLALAGCSLTYYGQAVTGQMEIWRKQKPTSTLIGHPATAPELRTRLELTRELLAFAESELLLANGGNYSSYADLGRDSVVWSVFAAPALSVDPLQWRYPVLGSLDYRGYFREESAEAFAAQLRAQGHDAVVVGVPAYSTLGWFRDPLLNTFIDWKETDFAALLFHELAHKKYYRKGDTAFSEAFAVAVEEEGVRRWLRRQGDLAGLAQWESRKSRLYDFTRRVLETREKLTVLYQSPDLSAPHKVTRKEAILGDLQSHVRQLLLKAGRTPEDSFWLRDDLSNAHLNVVAAYRLRVPEFEALLRACQGDLGLFYEEVRRLPSSSS